MARIRSVKPELRTDLTVAQWPREVRYAWVLLQGYLDDRGRGMDNMRLLIADLFPLDRDVTERKMRTWVELMAGSEILCRYEVAGQRYLHAVNWEQDQRINRRTRSRIPPCPVHGGPDERSVSGSVSQAVSRSLDKDPYPGERLSERLSESGSEPLTPRTRAGAPAALGSKGAREGDTREEGERRGTRWRPPAASKDPPPPEPDEERNAAAPQRPRCLAHRHLADDDPGEPCARCGELRLAAQAAAAAATTAAAGRARQAVRDCQRCDGAGYRLGLLGHPGVPPCDHQPYRPDPESAAAEGNAAFTAEREKALRVPCDHPGCLADGEPTPAGVACRGADGQELRAPAHAVRITAARKVPV